MPKPKHHYQIENFKLTHEHFGELEVELKLDKRGIIAILMKKILKTRFFKTNFYGGAISCELTEKSKIRTKAIRRLTGKP